MALDYTVVYPTQVESTDSAYPYGKAKNESTEGAGDGTPMEKHLVNDIWGLLQSLLQFASLTPSGAPDEYGASQYLTAIREVIRSDVVGDSGTTYAALLAALGGDLLSAPIASVPLVMTLNNNSRFSYSTETFNYPIYQSDITDAGKIIIPFSFPLSTWRILADGFIIGVDGGSFGRAGLPGTPPAASIYRRTPGSPPSTTSTLVGTFEDDSATVGAYEAYHELVIPNTELDPIDPRDQFTLVMTGEAGANAHTGLAVYSLLVKLYYKS